MARIGRVISNVTLYNYFGNHTIAAAALVKLDQHGQVSHLF